jgi:MerR family transcriptional regulator, light-induced transcriptional regulator
MSQNSEAAKVIQNQVYKIANLACDEMLEKNINIKSHFGESTKELWSDHLSQRLMELSAALEAGDCSLFTESLSWSRSAMQARGLGIEYLDSSLDELKLAIIKNLTKELSTAAVNYIDEAAETLAQTTHHTFDSQLDAGLPLDMLALQYVKTVVAGNVLPGMELIQDAIKHGVSIADAYLRVLLPAQQEVGRLWHLNALSISEEHLVSHTTQRLMALLANQANRKTDNGYTALAGAVEGNVHDIGIRAIAYLLEIEGWRTIFLGSDIPQEEISNTIETYEADVLLLSVALTSQLPTTTESIKKIKKNCDYPVKILVGGNGLSSSNDLWSEIGADGYASDANAALEVALNLVSKN